MHQNFEDNMRLGQLSRKIGVQPSRISTFLEEKNYTLEAGSNSKLTEEQGELIKAHFDYVEEETVPAVNNTELNKEIVPIVDVLQKEEATKKAEPLEDGEETSESDTREIIEKELVAEINNEKNVEELEYATETDEDKVIRAPKLKLEGLKVVGKIDLPEPKVKEEVTPTTDNTETPTVKVKEKPVRRKINQHKNHNTRPQKRTLTLEEKRAKKERERKRRNKEASAKKKQMKMAHYESKMRERELTSPKKSKRKTVKNEQQNTPEMTSPVPKSLFGKFLHWLNT